MNVDYSYMQRTMNFQKKAQKPVMGIHSEQSFPVKIGVVENKVSRSFLMQNPMQQQPKRMTSSSASVQAPYPFFATSENKQRLQQVQQRGATPIKGLNTQMSVYSTVDTENIPEQIKQLRQELDGMIGMKQEVQSLREGLSQAEKYIQQIFQSGILNGERDKNNQKLIEYLQKKFQELDLRTDQLDYSFKHSLKMLEENNASIKRQLVESHSNQYLNSVFEELRQSDSELKQRVSDTEREMNKLLQTPVLSDQINKFELFNREVHNYLENRQVHKQPEELSVSLAQSDVIDNYDFIRKPLSEINDQQNSCKQFDIYELTKSVEMTTQQKIKQQYQCQMSAISENQMEESCVDPHIKFHELVDAQGFLIEETGQFIRDAQGQQIRLSKEQIQWLRDRNMLEEV